MDKRLDREPLLKLVFAGALGSMLGNLLLENYRRGNIPISGYIFWSVLVVLFALYHRAPLTYRDVVSKVL